MTTNTNLTLFLAVPTIGGTVTAALDDCAGTTSWQMPTSAQLQPNAVTGTALVTGTVNVGFPLPFAFSLAVSGDLQQSLQIMGDQATLQLTVPSVQVSGSAPVPAGPTIPIFLNLPTPGWTGTSVAQMPPISIRC